jgi:GNAT superfamily N-acetyltransferase
MITYTDNPDIPSGKLLPLYQANDWSAAQRPVELTKGIANSATVIAAWDGELLVGLGNAITDGHLVVYFPHLLVHPDYHRQGIGTEIVRRLRAAYEGFHQQILVAEHTAIEFYGTCDFVKAGKRIPMILSNENRSG